MAGEKQIEDDEGLLLRRMAPGQRVTPVTPNDDTDNVPKNGTLRIGGEGTLRFLPIGNANDEVVEWTVTDGQEINVIVRRVLDTGTTATDIDAIT